MSDAKIYDLFPQVGASQLDTQVMELFGDNDTIDANELLQRAQLEGVAAAREGLVEYGFEQGVLDYLTQDTMNARRQLLLVPRRDAIEQDFFQIQTDEVENVDIKTVVRPQYFSKFQQMIEASTITEPTLDDRYLGVVAGYAFLEASELTAQFLERLYERTAENSTQDVLEQILETGVRSYYQNFATIEPDMVDDYRNSAILPRIAATIAYDVIISKLLSVDHVVSIEAKRVFEDMLLNRIGAAMSALETGLNPSSVDIGLAKPLSRGEMKRVLRGFCVLGH